MADLTIYLGNKNYSSWSLRPWLVLKRLTVGFEEVVIPLYQPTSRETVLKYSPSGRVPALRHGEVTVWESLAICEYLAESFPTFDLWPKDTAARALARACARALASCGHSNARGNASLRYSRIASDSQTCTSPSISTGTRPAGVTWASRVLNSGVCSGITSSSNGMPATVMASHGRSDQEE